MEQEKVSLFGESYGSCCQDYDHDQEEVLPFGESYWDYLPDIVQEYVVDLADKACEQELELAWEAFEQEGFAKNEHLAKMKKVLRCIKHPNKRQYIMDLDP